jgi:hypothetical protein
MVLESYGSYSLIMPKKGNRPPILSLRGPTGPTSTPGAGGFGDRVCGAHSHDRTFHSEMLSMTSPKCCSFRSITFPFHRATMRHRFTCAVYRSLPSSKSVTSYTLASQTGSHSIPFLRTLPAAFLHGFRARPRLCPLCDFSGFYGGIGGKIDQSNGSASPKTTVSAFLFSYFLIFLFFFFSYFLIFYVLFLGCPGSRGTSKPKQNPRPEKKSEKSKKRKNEKTEKRKNR